MKIKDDQEEQYEIPTYLTKVPLNYNLFSEFRPKVTESMEEQEKESSRRTESGDLMNGSEKEVDILNVNRAQFNIDGEEPVQDPVGQLKTYFAAKNKARQLHKARAKLASRKSLL